MRTLVLSVVVVALVGGWLGYRLADGRCESEKLTVARAYAANQDAAVAAQREHAAAESKRRTAQALRDERRASAARLARLRGQADARANPRPECAYSPERVRLISEAIAIANGAHPAAE